MRWRRKSGAAADRDAAVRWYRDYLDGFDDAPQAPATRLLLADLLFEGANFEAAAAEYERAAYSYGANPAAGRAGYAALVAYDKAEAQVPEAQRAALRLRAIDSSLRFADTFPEQAEVPGVLARTTKALFDAGDRERAESVAQRLLALGSRADAGQQLVAWTVLAHTYFDSARYVEAERAYGELSARLPPQDPCVRRSPSAWRHRSTDRPRRSRRRATSPVPSASSCASRASRLRRRCVPTRSTTRPRCS
jgi:cellulose synthase operon protein C